MELFSGSGFYGFVVEEDEEISDRLPSPRSWSKWGVKPQTFNPVNDHGYDFILIEDDPCVKEEFLGSDSEIYCSNYGKRRLDNSDTSAAPLGKSLKQGSSSEDQNHFLGVDGQLDDPFFHPLLNGLPQSTTGSLYSVSPLQGDQVSFDDFFLSLNMDSQFAASDSPLVKSEIHPFSPSCSREEEEEDLPTTLSLQHTSSSSEKMEACFESEHGTNDCLVDEIKASQEELVLQELETVLATFPKKTRLCFRDSLYRLAQNSRSNGFLHDELTLTNLPNRSVGKRMSESGTNPIDRAVANLMFNRMDMNIPGFRTSPSNSTSTLDQVQPLDHPFYSTLREASEILSFSRPNQLV